MDRTKIIEVLDVIQDQISKHDNAYLRVQTEQFVPKYETSGSAGLDLAANNGEPIKIKPGEVVKIPTGVRVHIPQGYFGAIYPRSSTGVKKQLMLANTVGIIDSDYRGEILLFFTNVGNNTKTINKGDRLAQMIIQPYYQAPIRIVDSLEETERGEGGFGSTGE